MNGIDEGLDERRRRETGLLEHQIDEPFVSELLPLRIERFDDPVGEHHQRGLAAQVDLTGAALPLLEEPDYRDEDQDPKRTRLQRVTTAAPVAQKRSPLLRVRSRRPCHRATN